LSHIEKPKSKKDGLWLVRTVMVIGLPIVVIAEILIISKILG